MVVIQTLFTNLTNVCHIICWMVCSLTVTYDWFPVILGKSWRVPHLGQEMLFGNTWFYFLGKFMILLIHYMYIIYYWICQFWDYVYVLMTLGLFAWISLAALFRTYFRKWFQCVDLVIKYPWYQYIDYMYCISYDRKPVVIGSMRSEYIEIWCLW